MPVSLQRVHKGCGQAESAASAGVTMTTGHMSLMPFRKRQLGSPIHFLLFDRKWQVTVTNADITCLVRTVV